MGVPFAHLLLMTPSLNVNLKLCDYDGHIVSGGDNVHAPDCASTPILIPCPIPPSVTFEVVLGECWCEHRDCIAAGEDCRPGHERDCPARTIRVTCSIGGKTWEESQVTAAEWRPRPDWQVELERPRQDVIERICRERWALVKALVLGHTDLSALLTGPAAMGLLTQRDAVFAALADMTRAERAAHAAFLSLPMEIRESSILAKAMGSVAADPTTARLPSSTILEHYVSHLISQAGAI